MLYVVGKYGGYDDFADSRFRGNDVGGDNGGEAGIRPLGTENRTRALQARALNQTTRPLQ